MDLVVDCLAGADRVANALARHHSQIDAEELRAVAHEALVREAPKVDLSKTNDPRRYLLWLVKQRLVDWLRQNGPVREQQGEWVERYPTVSLDSLSERERAVIDARYFEDQTQEVVAARLGVSACRVSQIEGRALARLRTILDPSSDERKELRPRELEVLEHAAEGLSTGESAAQLGLASETVKTHRRHAISSLGAKNLMNAVALGFRQGLLA